MIYFRSDIGRLGNKLFIIAYALYIKKKYGIDFIISDLSQLHYFQFPGSTKFINRIKSHYFFRIRQRISPIKKLNLLSLEKIHEITFDPNKNYKVMGYFQSDQYFKEYSQHIRDSITVKQKYRKQFKQKYQRLFDNYHVTVIHFRRTDYENHTIPSLGINNVILPISYYQKAIDNSSKKESKIVIIGDDLEVLEKSFDFIKDKIIIHDNEIVDFQILTHANTCIISNSTFAWWGAYLNRITDQVIAPKWFLGYNYKIEFPTDIYPNHWTLIE